MDVEQYNLMAREEETHWWYVGMRRITDALLDRGLSSLTRGIGSRNGLRILDAGCGTGGTTRRLTRRGTVVGIDLDGRAVELAKSQEAFAVVRGPLEVLPFRDAAFDVITSFDVICDRRIHDDVRGLRELCRVLRPGGILLIRVPAFDRIRGAHDRAVNIQHRYTRHELIQKLSTAGFRVEHASYANLLLFPIAKAKRLLERGERSLVTADLWRPPSPLNRLLAGLLAAEAPLVRTAGLPFGLSLMALARATPSARLGPPTGTGARPHGVFSRT